MKVTIDLIRRIARRPLTAKQVANAESVISALDRYGVRAGLDLPHRLAQYLPQVMHESGEFRYDREVWGPTPAQERYDTRTDLGNTPERDGDGKKNAGRGPLQVTGGFNIGEFQDWCVENIGGNVPNFRENPDLINTDPWEGLSAIWYWSTRGLNRYADAGDIEMITKRINGGLNGYADRLALYVRTALVMLGYEPDAIRAFQTDAKAKGLYTRKIDGDAGPGTRAALHKALAALSKSRVDAAPVTQREPSGSSVAIAAGGAAPATALAAPSIEDVVRAVADQQHELTSGDIARILVAAVIVGLTVWLAMRRR